MKPFSKFLNAKEAKEELKDAYAKIAWLEVKLKMARTDSDNKVKTLDRGIWPLANTRGAGGTHP